MNVADVVGTSGQLVVTRDPGIGEPFRGVVELVSGEIAKDLAFYLSESEQMPAAVVLGVRTVSAGHVRDAGGLLVQLLPGVSDDEALELTERIRDLGAVSGRLAAGEDPRQWLATIFPEGCSMMEETPVRFFCGCSVDRVEATLKLLGIGEIRAAMDEENDRRALVTCGFCRADYELPIDRLRELIKEVESERA